VQILLDVLGSRGTQYITATSPPAEGRFGKFPDSGVATFGHFGMVQVSYVMQVSGAILSSLRLIG
jgi:hypothetical protein